MDSGWNPSISSISNPYIHHFAHINPPHQFSNTSSLSRNSLSSFSSSTPHRSYMKQNTNALLSHKQPFANSESEFTSNLNNIWILWFAQIRNNFLYDISHTTAFKILSLQKLKIIFKIWKYISNTSCNFLLMIIPVAVSQFNLQTEIILG